MQTHHIFVALAILVVGMLVQKWFDPLGKIGV